MNFLAPGAFFLGLLLPVIVALYLLKLRRIERDGAQHLPVAANGARCGGQRALAAPAPQPAADPAAAVPGCADPGAGPAFHLDAKAPAGRPPSSSSIPRPAWRPPMSPPAGSNRPRQRASQLVDDLPDNARVTVIEAGREARVLLSSSLDRRQAHLAIEEIQPGTGGSDLGVALELASAIAARQPGTEIIVLSDGRVNLPERLALKGHAALHPLWPERRKPGHQPAHPGARARRAAGLTAFAQVSNYGEKPGFAPAVTCWPTGCWSTPSTWQISRRAGRKRVIAEGLPAGNPDRRSAARPGRTRLPLDDQAMAVQPRYPARAGDPGHPGQPLHQDRAYRCCPASF